MDINVRREGNKLIEIFRFPAREIKNNWVHWNDGYGTQSHIDGLDYHANWNTLMPIIEKISRIEFDREENELPLGGTEILIHTHYPRTFGMLNDKTGRPMFRYNCGGLFEADTLIEAAWLATVDFLNSIKENDWEEDYMKTADSKPFNRGECVLKECQTPDDCTCAGCCIKAK